MYGRVEARDKLRGWKIEDGWDGMRNIEQRTSNNQHRTLNIEGGRAAKEPASSTDDFDFSRGQPWQEHENAGHQRQSFIKLGAASREHHHRDLKLRGVLLKTQVAVCGDEDLEFFLGQRKQPAVFDAAPAPFLNGHALMPGQRAAQTPLEAFVKENAHGRRFRAFSTDRLQ